MGALGKFAVRVRAHLLFLMLIFATVVGALAQSVEPSDINIGLRADDNVRDVQAEAIGVREVNVPKIETAQRAIEYNQAILTGINRALENLPLTPPSRSLLRANSISLERPTLLKKQAYYQGEVDKDQADIVKWKKELHFGTEQDSPIIKTLTRYTFTNNNSFIGKGVLATNAFDNGIDIQLPEGTEISPYFTYAHAADKAAGTKTGTNLIGGTLSLSQKLFPLVNNFPKAYRILSDDAAASYPGIDLLAGTDFTFGNTNKFTYKSGAGSGYNQDGWTVTPNVTCDIYLSKLFTIALIPSYAYGTTTTDRGLSGSNGVFQFQDRNTFLLDSKTDGDGKITSAFQVYETNSLERDVNLEPQPPTTADGYQTWGKFGAGINLIWARKYSFAAQYTYEAFNTSYQAHYVTASFNYQF